MKRNSNQGLYFSLLLIILYTILKINQVILYNLTEFKKIKFFVENYHNMFYNNTEKITMGEFVVSPILLLTADSSGTFTATVVIAGIVIVVGMLLLLILIFNLFGKFVPVLERMSNAVNAKMSAWKSGIKAKRAAKKGESPEIAEPAPVLSTPPIPATPAPAPIVEQGISDEVVAAIAAAVAATEGSGAVVRSIKKKNVGGRNPWSAAATADNTRPF